MKIRENSGVYYTPAVAPRFPLRFLLPALLLFVFAPLWAVAAPAQQDFETAFRAGSAALREGRLAEAADAFTKCTRLEPDFAEAYLNLGLVRIQQGQFADATTALDHAVKLKPAMRGAHLFLGIARYRMNDETGALAALRKEAAVDPTNATAYLWLGVVELAQGNPSGAAADLDKASELKPDDVDILYHRGRAHMLLSRDIYEHMYQVKPDSWRIHQVLAQAFLESDRLEDAIRECQEALKLKPGEPGLHAELADVYFRQNHLEQAEAEFEAELKIDPVNLDAMYKLGMVRIERSKPTEAERLLTKVLEYHPDSAEAHYQLGRAQAQLGESEPAARNFAAVVAEPGKVDGDTLKQSYYQLSQLYRRLGHPDRAKEALAQFVKLKQQADAGQQQKLQDKLKRNQESPTQ